jgi:hypothetical protein
VHTERIELTSQHVGKSEARAIARDAYLYAFAMLESYDTWYRQAVDSSAKEYLGGFNVFRHYSQPFSPANRDVVTPNNDTPYSLAWLDLRAEPMVLRVPHVPRDRYYVFQLVDLFTYIVGYVGVRATGFDAGDYLITGPRFDAEPRRPFKQVFRAETEIVGVLGRTELRGPDDVPALKRLQESYQLQPLSAYQGRVAPPPAPRLAFPAYDRARARTHDFIGYLNFLLSLAEPPHPSEVLLRKRFERIGIVPGAPFDARRVERRLLSAIDAGVKDAQNTLAASIAATKSSRGLFGTREFLGQDYLKRDIAAATGLYGNALEEAYYCGTTGDGSALSVLRFPKGKLPPAKFFWSITLYTQDRFLYDNALARYSIGDRTPGLVYGGDGSLTLYVGNTSPGKARENNWLPAPRGPYLLVVRVYGPSEAVIHGDWKMPALTPLT